MQNNVIDNFLNNIHNLKSHKKINKIKVSKNLYEYMRNNIIWECKKLIDNNISISSVFGYPIVIDKTLNNIEWEVEYEK